MSYTPEQRALALEHANAIRNQDSRLLASIRAAGRRNGARLAAQVVMRGEASVRIGRLVLAVRRVGDQTARQMLGTADVNGMVRVRELSPGRRELLAGLLLRYGETDRDEPPPTGQLPDRDDDERRYWGD